jgi:hypothetical protein
MSSPLVSITVTELVLRHLVSQQPRQQQQQATISLNVLMADDQDSPYFFTNKDYIQSFQ